MTRRGVFIVLEGIDGAGTTTQAALLTEAMRHLGATCLLTREPSTGPVGKLLRQGLTGQIRDDAGPVALDWTTFALLFAADRMDHVRREIEPALNAGAVVVSDRYDLSSLIYQSETAPEGSGALDWLRQLNAPALRPDLTIVLRIDADIAQRRRMDRGGEAELFEQDALQRRLAQRYAEAAAVLPQDRIVVLEGNQAPDTLALQIRARIIEALPWFFAPNLPEKDD